MIEQRPFMNYKDIQNETKMSKSKCYEVIREINTILNKKGINTFKGRVLTSAYKEYYGIDKPLDEMK